METMECLLKCYYNLVLVVDFLESYQLSYLEPNQGHTGSLAEQLVWNYYFMESLFKEGVMDLVQSVLLGIIGLVEGLDLQVCEDGFLEESDMNQEMCMRILDYLCTEGNVLFEQLYFTRVDLQDGR